MQDPGSSPAVASAPMDAVERRRLRARGRVAAMATVVATLALAALIWLLATDPVGALERGRRWLLAALLLAWVWMLRAQPRRWLRIRADLLSGSVQVQCLRGAPVERRGFGLFAPVHRYLQAGGRLLDADGIERARLWSDREVVVRSAPRSGVVLDVLPAPAPATPPPAGEDTLTGRERMLLDLLARGLSDKLIARELDLAPGTVRTYNSALFRKLGAGGRLEAIERARERGLLPVD